MLEQEYDTWVKNNVQYNAENNIPDGITDEAAFKHVYSCESFIENQYNQFIQTQFSPQQEAEQPVEEEVVEQI